MKRLNILHILSESTKYILVTTFIWLALVAPFKIVQTGLIWFTWPFAIGAIIYSFLVLACRGNLYEKFAKGDDRKTLDSITVTTLIVSTVFGLVVSWLFYIYTFEKTAYLAAAGTVGTFCSLMKFLSLKEKIETITHDMHLYHLLNRWNEGEYLYVANKVEHLDKKKAMTFFNKVIKYNGVKDGEILLKLIDD